MPSGETDQLPSVMERDAINLQNRSQFAALEVSRYSANFGKVTSQTDATPRPPLAAELSWRLGLRPADDSCHSAITLGGF